jgi:hypothetical protein
MDDETINENHKTILEVEFLHPLTNQQFNMNKISVKLNPLVNHIVDKINHIINTFILP